MAVPQETGRKTILVVDDDGALRDVLVEFLTEQGYLVREAASGEEALTLLAQRPCIKLMLTDVRMPGMDGLELADRAEQQDDALKVIVMSGYFAGTTNRPFLRKPFHLHDLTQALAASRP